MFGTLIYINFTKERISLLNLKSGQRADFPAQVTFCDSKVMAVGENAREAERILKLEGKAAQLIEPFAGPRGPVDNFEAASAIFKYGILMITRRWFFLAPVVLLHALEQYETPLNTIELRVLQELAESAGARKVIISNESYVYSEADIRNFMAKTGRA